MSSVGAHCIFCDIAAGEAPAHKIYEDAAAVAFMDICPLTPGHFLVIPRTHVDHFIDLPEDVAAHVTTVGQRLARKAQALFNPKRMGFLVHGFGVAHAHLNVVPLYDGSDITSAKAARLTDGKIVFAPGHVPAAVSEELETIARNLRDV